jgi:hypothetical protein
MPYVGNKPEVGNFRKCDAITTSATATYNLLVGGVAVNPNQNQCIVSLNGVIQSSGNSYTIANSQITMASALTSSDVIDFILILGDTLDVGVPSDDTVDASKITANIITGQSALGATPADTDELLISDAGTLKRVDYSYLKSSVVNRPNAQALIINGNMDVWQRGTATVTTTGDYVGVDRFKISEDTDGSFSTERHTMSNAEFTTTGFGYALQADCTGTDASIGASQTAEITQKIEAQNLQLLQYGTSNAKNLTLSFWVKSSKTGTYCVAIRKRDTTSYDIPIEYSISSADTWEKKVLNISPTAGSTSLITSSGGVIDNNNGDGLHVTFCLAIGSNFQGTNNTWVAASKLCTSNQVNWMDSTSNDFYLTGVQLEVGEYSASTLPSFQHETYAANLARCQRYYYKMIDENVALATFSYYSASRVEAGVSFPVTMRTAPSLISTSGSSYFRVQRNGGDNNLNDLSGSNVGLNHASIYNTDEASGTAGDAGYGYSRANGVLSWNSEL